VVRELRFWRRRRAEDEDIDRELDVHLDLAAEERIEAGIPRPEAQLDAHREFGNIALTKETLRDMRSGAALERMLSHAVRDFLYGLRLLRRSPAFTTVAVLILALPIAAITAVFSMVSTALLQGRPGRIDTLVAVFSRDRQQPDSYRNFSYPLYANLREQTAIFDSVMAHTVALAGIREGDTTRRAFVELVSSNYFSTLGVALAAGRPFSPDEERPGANALVAIGSYATWRLRGFDPGFVGSQVRVNGARFTVVGIAPQGLRTSTLVAPDWWFPLGTYDRVINEWFLQGPKGLDNRTNPALFVAGALKPGVTRATAEQALDALSWRLAREFPATDRDRSFQVAGVPRLNLTPSPENERPVAFLAGLLTSMAALVLAVACLNLANLMLARGAARRREIGIRQALGGSRGRIIGQLCVEGLTLSTIGATAGLLLSWWAAKALSAWFAGVFPLLNTGGIEFTVEPSRRMVYVAGGLAVFSALCFALGPAWRLSRPSVTADLKLEPGFVVRRFGSGAVLVGIQLTISLALLAVSGLFVRSAVEAAGASPGFALDHTLVFSLDPSLAAYDEPRTRDLYRNALRDVHAVPGVEHASLASKVAFGEFVESASVAPIDRRGEETAAGFTIITAEYFETLRLPMLRGRGFTPGEDERAVGIPPAVISEPLVRRLFRDGDAIGRQITMRSGGSQAAVTATIVGVVPGTIQDILDVASHSQIYLPYGARFRAAMTLHVGIAPHADEAATLSAVQRALRRLDDQLPILTARTMAAQRDASIPRWAVRAAAIVFGVLGLLALAIATIGVYGLEAYDVARRTQEIGIRMALGATDGDITWLVLRKALLTTAVGLSLGLLLAAGIGRLVSSILYKVNALDPTALIAAAIILAGATLIACYLPARRAAHRATLDALRAE
jgi:predicted permease